MTDLCVKLYKAKLFKSAQMRSLRELAKELRDAQEELRPLLEESIKARHYRESHGDGFIITDRI